ncbi:MAG: hypothetical protein KDC24_10885 [Saprospiraceae bacterium]|nr:hypothetical protein [Saprospiraceae bacterium]
MKPVFISIVGVLQHPSDWSRLETYLLEVGPTLQDHYTDFEIILIQNTGDPLYPFTWEKLPDSIRKNTYWIKLSNQVNKNHAILAGLDRANGDYTVVFGLEMTGHADLITELHQKTSEGYDIVYLRSAKPGKGQKNGLFRKVFYFIMDHYSELKIDPQALDTRIISRRALNNLLKLRENLRFMKAIYSMVGYPTAYICIQEVPETNTPGFGENFRTSLLAITSFTTFLKTLSLWIFLFSVGIAAVVILNAFLVKLAHVDIFGTPQEALSGWAFMIVVIAVFFSITFLNFYLLTIFISNIYHEIKNRPLYIVESIQRV